MKLQPLLFAVALAAGAAFAQAPQGSAKPADTQAGNTANPSTGPAAPGKSHKKAKHTTAHHSATKHHEHVASAKHHGEHHAMEHHHGTGAMGAGPSVDLNSSSRQQRMDQAYSDWGSRQH